VRRFFKQFGELFDDEGALVLRSGPGPTPLMMSWMAA
jgi:hypothetical protein